MKRIVALNAELGIDLYVVDGAVGIATDRHDDDGDLIERASRNR